VPLFARESVGQALRLPANGVATTAATRVRHLPNTSLIPLPQIVSSRRACVVAGIGDPGRTCATPLRDVLASATNGCLLAKLFRTFYRQSGSDLPPFKKSGSFQPLLFESTQSLTIFVFKKSAVVSRR
jgi:hypothetical protein